MKKISVLLFAALVSANLTSFVFAEPIVELAAPRPDTPKIINDDGTPAKPAVETKAQDKSKAKKNAIKKAKRIVHKKPKPIVVNYDKVSKMIEYSYFDDADRILQGAMSRNSKDIKAQALWVVSLAKQCKLDPAQDELNALLKKYPNNSNLHYAQGVVYFKRTTSSNMFYRNNAQKLYSDSLSEFNKALLLDKNNAKAYNAAGVVSLSMGNTNDARAYFQKAISLDKTYSAALDNLGTMDYVDGKFDVAQKKFNLALTYNTQNSTAMYHLAQVAMQNDDYIAALHYLNNALAINPNSPAIYNLMGKAYKAQGNEAAAINAFKKSLMIKPEFVLSYSDLADIYEKRGDGEFAIEELKTAISINPNYNDAKLKLADISLSNAKYPQAISVYSELVGVDGYNAPALKGLAGAYYAQAQVAANKAQLGSNKDLFKALDSINKAIAANGTDLELHLAKLKITKLTNQPDLTKIELQKIVGAPNNDLMSTVVKGEAYLAMNDYQNAQSTFNTAIELSKTDDDDLYLSEIFMYHKQYDPAENVLQKILKTNPQNAQAISDLDYIQKSKKYAESLYKSALYFVKSKNLTTAMEYLSRSLAADPNNANAHFLLGQLYERQKDYKNAAINYKAYLNLAADAQKADKLQKKIDRFDNSI